MKNLKAQLRAEIKKVIIETNGNVLNAHINAIREKYNCGACAVQNAYDYFQYSPQQAAFRAKYNV